MGFYINKEITTKLHYKDIVIITTAIQERLERYGDKMDKGYKKRSEKLVSRLVDEMYDNKENEKSNGH